MQYTGMHRREDDRSRSKEQAKKRIETSLVLEAVAEG